MYFLVAVFAIIIGICIFAFVSRVTKSKAVIACAKIVSIVLAVAGLIMLYLVFSGKVVLPLSNR